MLALGYLDIKGACIALNMIFSSHCAILYQILRTLILTRTWTNGAVDQLEMEDGKTVNLSTPRQITNIYL